jgi:hypothetical protein
VAKLQDSVQTSKNLSGGMVNYQSKGSNSNGVPYGQTPGFMKGTPKESDNELPSNAKVTYPASSHLMGTDSHNRGPEQKGSGG